jgi:hypothetical protein
MKHVPAIAALVVVAVVLPASAQTPSQKPSQAPTPPPTPNRAPAERIQGVVESVGEKQLTLRTGIERIVVDLSRVRADGLKVGDHVAVTGVMGPEREVMIALRLDRAAQPDGADKGPVPPSREPQRY